MEKAERIARLLGEQGHYTTLFDLIRLTRKGIHSKGVTRLLSTLDLSRDDFADAVGIKSRTLSRRFVNPNTLLSSEESEKTVRVARIFIEAMEVLGSEEKARTWLKRPNKALGNQLPIQCLDSDLGTEQVIDILGRIREGVYS